jgi:hypothetical protein
MKRVLAIALLLTVAANAVAAGPMRALDDRELEKVNARDGISFAAHIAINDPTLVGAVSDSRLSLGFHDNGQTRYVVLQNVRGVIDMSTINIDVHARPDGGGDYVALTLPNKVMLKNFGFESMSVQNDPLAPVTGGLGSFNVNGEINMQGQVRMWAH